MKTEQEMLEAIDERGELGVIDLATKTPDGAAVKANLLAVRLGDGATVFAATNRFAEIQPGKFRFNGSFEILRRQSNAAGQTHRADILQNSNRQNTDQQNTLAADAKIGEIVIPVIAEEIQIAKRAVETGGVRVHKTVREDVQTIDEPIIREHLAVERIEINQFVETAPSVRYEGETMIVPVLEEVVVTQKRLLLREEVRLTKRREEISDPQQVVLRREEINLEKIEP